MQQTEHPSRSKQWLDLATYAEERDSWTPSYRASIDRRLDVGDGDEQRVRLKNGSEVTALWYDRGGCRGWEDAEGNALDVAAVELAS